MLRLYSSVGVPLWTNSYNGPGDDEDAATAIAVDASGNVFVTGYSTSANGNDYATIAYSGAGLPLWTNRYHGPANGYDRAASIAIGGLSLSCNVPASSTSRIRRSRSC